MDKLNVDPDWLRQMAEKENGCIISVGGLVTRMNQTDSMNDQYVDPSEYLDANSLKDELLSMLDELRWKLSIIQETPESDSFNASQSLAIVSEVSEKIKSIFSLELQQFIDHIKAQDEADTERWEAASY